MPSRRATWRASSTVAGEQQLPKRWAPSWDGCHGHTRSVMPTTSKPCSTRTAAATEESTPPESPTTMRGAMTRVYATYPRRPVISSVRRSRSSAEV
jgi:hypothetical protein